MADIKGYVAPNTRLRPAEAGFSAFETAARRVGIAYREGATDYTRIGEVQQRAIEANRWPFDILELEDRTAREAAASSRGGGFRARLGGGGGRTVRGHNAVNAGMGALGDWIGNVATARPGGPGGGGELVDVASGQVSFRGTGGRVMDVSDTSGPILSLVPGGPPLGIEQNPSDIYNTGIVQPPPSVLVPGSKAGTSRLAPDPNAPTPGAQFGGGYFEPTVQEYQGGSASSDASPGFFSGLGSWLTGGSDNTTPSDNPVQF